MIFVDSFVTDNLLLLFVLSSMIFQTIISVASIDSHLGRLDYASLSQQTLMELFIDSITNRTPICGSEDYTKDVAEWERLTFNSSKEIICILWYSLELGGSIEMKWLPQSVVQVHLSYNKFIGTVDLTCLPDGLEILSVSRNKFEGAVDLTQLPSGVQKLYLYDNNFQGSTDFSKLPKTLNTIEIRGNKIEGEISDFDGFLDRRNTNVKDMRKK